MVMGAVKEESESRRREYYIIITAFAVAFFILSVALRLLAGCCTF